nr:unnamed protein product [Callosobruchus analis]
MGDFNAHHPLWGSSRHNHNGNVVFDFVNDCQLVIHNDGTPTRFTPVNNQPSPLDLCISTPGLALGTVWSVWDDCANSDHYPTLAVLNQGRISLEGSDFTHFNLFNLRKADWPKYQSSLSLNFDRHDNQNFSEPLVKIRKNELTQFKLHPTIENFLEAKRQIALTNRHLRKTKKTKCRHFCESLNRNSNISHVWKIIKKFDNKNIGGQKQVLPKEEVASQILVGLTVNHIPTTLTIDRTESYTPFRMVELRRALLGQKTQHLV